MRREARVLRSPVMLRLRGSILLLSLTALAAPALAAVRLDPLQNDYAQYLVYSGTRLLGTEKISLEPAGDSVSVFSNVDEIIPTADGDQKLVKKVQMEMKALDYDLLGYSSEQHFLNKKLLRGVVMVDTVFSTYRELEGHGSGDSFVRPPGRMFVVDSQAFVLFDVMLRSLHGKPTDPRTLPVLILGEPRDTVLQITLSPEPKDEPLAWGKGSISTRRYTITDGSNEFLAWIDAKGRMVKLEQPASGLRVLRDPKPLPEVRPAGKSSSTKSPAAKPSSAAKPPTSH